MFCEGCERTRISVQQTCPHHLRIQGVGTREARIPTLFLDQTEAETETEGPKKLILRPPPLSQGLDDRSPHPRTQIRFGNATAHPLLTD